MNPIDKLTQLFSEFPGIGPRQARRFVYALLSRDSAFAEMLAEEIKHVKRHVAQCGRCARFFTNGAGNNALCEICRDPGTDQSVFLIVEKDSDLENIKKSGAYGGRYYVLGGTVPLTENTAEGRVRIKELKKEVDRTAKESGLSEIIFGLSATPEGEHTAAIVREELTPAVSEHKIKTSALGRGLSTGTELEYSDSDTLQSALENRK